MGEVEHAGRISAIGGLGFAEQDVRVHRAVARDAGPLDGPVVEVQGDLGRGSGVAVEERGELGGAGADHE